VIVLLSPLIASRFSFDNLVESRSITERVEQYETFGELIFERPLLGVGLNNYTLAIAEINPGNEWWEYQPVHNVWALMVGELGIVSLVFVFGGLVSVLRIHRHRIWLLCIGLTPLFIISLFDHYLWTLWPGIALVALSAAVVTRINSQG